MKGYAALLISLAVMISTSVYAQCPSYTASSPNNTGSCATNAAAGNNPTLADWQNIFDLVAKGPAAWTNAPTVLQMKDGCSLPTPQTMVTARFPCELIKAMAFQESSWRQFCVPTSPADQAGKPSQTIIASDCGYGVAQVTSGMRTFDPSPSFDRQRVAAEPFYNLAAGMQIFSDKWRISSCIGDRRPHIVEHWYFAVWAYNGLSSKNDPNNPNYSTTRGVYVPGVSSSTRPYQEIVWGRMQAPPSNQYWTPFLAAYPKLTDVNFTSTGVSPPAMPDPSCASPTSCSSTRPIHISSCLGGGTPDAGTPDAGMQKPDAGPAPTDSGVVVEPPVDAGQVDAGPVDERDAGTEPIDEMDAGEVPVEENDAGMNPPENLVLDHITLEIGPAERGCGCSNDMGATVALVLVLASCMRRSRRS